MFIAFPNMYPWIRNQIFKPSSGVFIVLVALPIISFIPALLTDSHDLQITEGGDFIIPDIPPGVDGIAIAGRVSQFDWSGTGKLSVTWAVMACGNYTLQNTDALPFETTPPNTAVDVYINDISKPAFSYDPISLPVTRDGGVSIKDLVTFNTDHIIDFGKPEYHAPNDWYTLYVTTFVIGPATNTSLPIVFFGLMNSGAGDFSVLSPEGVPTYNQFTYNGKGGPTTVTVESYLMFPTFERSRRGQALIYFMFSINWIMTLCSIITTAVIFNREDEVKDGVALLPITVILAIPAIRNLYPGAPSFGIYLDVVGFFPQMFIVVVCTVMVLLFCSRRPTGSPAGAVAYKKVDAHV